MAHKLLLADDSLTIQKVVELVLAPENFEIRSFNDGEQALQAMGSFIPDIVLADIEMPKLNGYQLCEKIKNDMATGHIPVILLAGAFEPFDEEYAKSVYADDFIIKPFESQELISKVKALLVSVEPVKEPLVEEQGPSISVDVMEAEEPMAVNATAGEELAWNEEPPVVQVEEVNTQDIFDQTYEGKGTTPEVIEFEQELVNALKEEVPAQAGEFEGPFGAGVTEEITDISKPEAEGVMSSGLLSAAIKDSAERTISSIAPDIIENVTREIVQGFLGSLRNDIDAAIRKIVPEVAEAIIKKEIEKITSEIK